MIDLTQDADGIVTLTWDMPGRSQNVFNQASMDAFEDALTKAFGTEGVTGVLLASAKRDFIAGADLEMLEGMAFGANRDAATLYEGSGRLGEILRRMETGGVPVAVAIGGVAMGGGLEVCLACHRRFAADDPRVQLGLPEGTLGILPGAGGTQRLPRLIGAQASLPLMLEGKRLGAQEALALGIVDEVVPKDELIARAKAWLGTRPSAVQPWDAKGFEPPGGSPATSPDVANLFMAAAALFQAKTYGRYPAGKAILSCVNEGLRLGIDDGLLVEKRYFVELILDPVAGNMIRTMFLSMQDARKLVRRPADVPRLEVAKVGVLGAGLMGSGIAYAAAKTGKEVVVLDTTADKAAGALAYAQGIEGRKLAKGRTTEAQIAALVGRIHPTTDYADLAGCDVVIEAVFEDRGVKADATAKADAVLDDHAVFGSNTSTLPITGLAKASSRPERFVGLHFFSPVEKMQLVEVIRAEQTSDATLAHALDVVAALGKIPIVVHDSRGFYTSRVFGTYVTEGLVMLRDGVKPAMIENVGKATGMPMPPLGLADEVGLGLMHQVGVQTRADLGDAAPDNPGTPVLEVMVQQQQRTGKRGGKGFYDYDGKTRRLWPGLADHFPLAADQPDAATLEERFLYVQAVEAARCMDEGILLAAADADVGAVLGWGFAPWTGGPLSFIDTVGVQAFVDRADALADAYGERFRPPGLLRVMAAEGRTFYA
ncbi:MAG: enoyl-CoA hydratase/isomerase family protein [Alphaproteobacteria bacterium]|nr:enoyl-CoA hydratase/isomerase family protein [Alphaproteobacteria bacterium]